MEEVIKKIKEQIEEYEYMLNNNAFVDANYNYGVKVGLEKAMYIIQLHEYKKNKEV